MHSRFVGFALLVWFPGALHGKDIKFSHLSVFMTYFTLTISHTVSAQSCGPPRLTGGFFVPELETYADGANISYRCEPGYKPVADGWWAKSTCQSGKWINKPQCIGEC